MHLAGRTQMVDHMDYDKAVTFYLDLGFEGVELNNIYRDFTPRPDFFDKDTIKKAKAALRDSRVKGFSIGSHMDYVYDDECFGRVVASMDTALDLGTDLIIINGCRSGDGGLKEWSLMADRTASLCGEAEKRGVRLCKEFEPLFIAHNTSHILKLIKDIGSPALWANLDLGHVFLEDGAPLEMIKKIGPRIAHCHIENMAAGIHNHLPFDEGDMDLPVYLKTLAETGFTGQLSFDYYNDNYLKDAPRCIGLFKEWTGT